MASSFSAALCALLALVLWSAVGWIFARRLPLPRALALPLAPLLGWAVQSVLALAVTQFAGFTAPVILAATVVPCALALTLVRGPKVAWRGPAMPLWVYGLAAVVAFAPAVALLPKAVGDGILLSAPIFDHAKVALIDEIARNGVPPANPVFGDGPGRGAFAYYYLWQFSAAQLARLTGASGWEADIAATWFTAFATLSLMCGLAFALSRRALGPVLVLLACLCGSLRPVLALAGQDRVDAVLEPASGLAGWLFQVTWSPHHVAAAGCTVLATLIMAAMARRFSLYAVGVLGLVLAAGFQSSLWVGGVMFIFAGFAVAFVLLLLSARDRLDFVAGTVGAGLLGAVLSAPLIAAQLNAAVTRGGGLPVIVEPFHVLGPFLPDGLGRLLDLPAYWLVLLVVEFPLVFLPGVVALGLLFRGSWMPYGVRALTALAAVSLACGWLLVSTTGENNDLGWRSILPGVMVMTVYAAAGLSRWMVTAPRTVAAVVALGLALGLPDGVGILKGNLRGEPTPQGAVFAQSPALWEAVRRWTPPDGRVANNPAFLKDLTPWPVNISWALLAQRRSCFAGDELALAFAAITPRQRGALTALFARVFAGEGTREDVEVMAKRYGCVTAVVTAQDGAFANDPFAISPRFRLAETVPGQWRIYVAVPEPAYAMR